MAEQTPQIAGDRDRVFNAETVRALRRMSRTPQALFVAMLVGFPIILVAIEPLISLSSPLPRLLVIAYSVAVVLTGFWAAMPTREVRREVKHALIWTFARIVGRDHKLPAEYQPAEDDHDEPLAVPALALGRAPIDWFFIFSMPLVGFSIVTDTFEMSVSIPLLGGCIALGAVMFWITPLLNTYPPEDSP